MSKKSTGLTGLLEKTVVFRDGELYNMTTMKSTDFPNGKFNITLENRDSFIDKYYNYVFKKGCNSYLLEKPFDKIRKPFFNNALEDANSIKIDLDFRFPIKKEEIEKPDLIIRKYDIKDIKKLLKTYIRLLDQYIEITDDMIVHIMEKENPIVKKIKGRDVVKDGIHIMFEKILVPNKILYKVREELIEHPDIINIFENMKTENPISDIVDIRVISKNSWFLYGSKKPNDLAYKVSKSYKVDLNSDKIIHKLDKKISNKSLIKNLSNLFASKNCILKKGVDLSKFNDYSYDDEKFENKTSKLLSTYCKEYIKKPTCDSYTSQYLIKILHCLKQERADNYTDWFKICQSLYNIDHRNNPLFHNFSRKSDKYDGDSCNMEWEKAAKNSLKYANCGIQLLIEMAMEDNPEKFRKLQQNKKTETIEKYMLEIKKIRHRKGFNAVSVSKLTKEYLDYHCEFRHKCITTDGKHIYWFYYDYSKHRWIEDNGGLKSIQSVLINELLEDFKNVSESYRKGLNRINTLRDEVNENLSGLTNNGENIDEINAKEQKYHQNRAILDEIISYYECNTKRKQIIENLAILYNDPMFYNIIDTNPYIFICNNGVLDLEKCVFRQGVPEDMTMLHTNIDYISIDEINENEEHLENMLELENILRKILPDKEVRNYWLDTYSRGLDGLTKPETMNLGTGCGSNGKTRLMCILLEKVFGNYYYKMDAGNLTRKRNDPNSASPALAALRGKRIVVCEEPDADGKLATGIMKELTGGGELTARELHKPLITFKIVYIMTMLCNDKPDLPSVDGGVIRRICVFNYISTFLKPSSDDWYKLKDTKKYPNYFKADMDGFDDKLRKLAPYLLTLLFENYKILKENKFKSKVPISIQNENKTYINEQNIFAAFKTTFMIKHKGSKIKCSDAFERFKDWCNSSNRFARRIDQRQFCSNIENLIKIKNDNGKWKNWLLIEPNEDDDNEEDISDDSDDEDGNLTEVIEV